MKNRKIYVVLIVAILFQLLAPCIFSFAAENNENTNDLKIYSEAAILMDSNTGKVLYDKSSKERKFPASTTKILTAILTIENCENLDEIVTVDFDSIDMVPSGYTVATLQVGEEITINQLLQVLLVHSANDAANVLAKRVGGTIEDFVSMMNEKAKEIGCKDSHFTNPSGKQDENHYSTAYDLALIMNYCMKNSTFRSLAGSKSCIIPATNKYSERVYTNSNELLVVDTRDVSSNYYYPFAIAGKTGYTAEAKNCLVSVASKDDLELICVILGALRTDEGLSARFIDTKQLFEYGYSTYTIRKLREKGAIAKQIEVPNATKETKDLDLLITDDITVLIKQKYINAEIQPEIELNEGLSAPISQGQVVGKIKYEIEGINYSSDLIASHSVEKNNFFLFIVQLALIGFILYMLYKTFYLKNKPNKTNRSHITNYYNNIK